MVTSLRAAWIPPALAHPAEITAERTDRHPPASVRDAFGALDLAARRLWGEVGRLTSLEARGLSGVAEGIRRGLGIGARVLRTAAGAGVYSVSGRLDATREVLAACGVLPYPRPMAPPVVNSLEYWEIRLRPVGGVDTDGAAGRSAI